MTRQEIIAEVASRTGETAEVVTSFVNAAAQEILNYVYPFHPNVEEVPARYQQKQIDIAVFLVNKRGAEGETQHDENGINRKYENSDIPKSYFDGLMPFGKAPSSEV